MSRSQFDSGIEQWIPYITNRDLIQEENNPFSSTTPPDEKDIFSAFNEIAAEFYSTTKRRTLFLNAILFIVVFLGNFSGAQYAENFAETFSDKIFDTNEGAGFDFFKSYVPAVYMIANIAISMISAHKTIDEIKKSLQGNPLYAEWMTHNKRYLGLEKAQMLVSVLFAGLACFALNAQNKDPDSTTSAAAYFFSLVCQYIGVAINASLLTRSFTTLFKYFPDFNALITGNIEDRENTHAAKLHVLEKIEMLFSDKPNLSLNMVAQGFNNPITPVVDIVATAGAAVLLYPYVQVNYGAAAAADTSNQTALDLSNLATYGVLALCSRATAGVVNSITDKVHSMITHTPKIHHASDSSLLGLILKVLGIAAPSMAAAAGRFAEFSGNPLETKAQVLSAYLNALRAVGINAADVDRVSSILYKKSADFAPAPLKEWANKTKFGKSLEDFLYNFMREASSDNFIRKLLKPVVTYKTSQEAEAAGQESTNSTELRLSKPMPTEETHLLLPSVEEPKISVAKKGYPAASIFGLGLSYFRPNKGGVQNFEVKNTSLYNSITLLQKAKEHGYDLKQLYKDWLVNPLTNPEDIIITAIPPSSSQASLS